MALTALMAQGDVAERTMQTDYLAIARTVSRGAAHASASPTSGLHQKIAEDDPSRPENIPAVDRESEVPVELARPRTRATGCCDRCGYLGVVDVPIHDGRSTRRDCARCHRFRCFSKWYGRNLTVQGEADGGKA